MQLNIVRFTIIFLSVLFASCSSSKKVVGVEEGWEVLASNKVDFVKDKDVIDVKTKEKYTALRFRVEDHDIHISELAIYFSNGDKLEPSIDETIKAGESSKYIEIGEEGRYIDHIEFKYRTTGSILKGRGDVLVLGKRYDDRHY